MRRLLVICGATATGKTALAVECAKKLNGEVVSCDALLVYRGLNIGTAKPTEAEKAGIVHHMIDVAEPTQDFSVSDFERLALPIVEDILARGKTPVLCGGTGFYMNSVLYKHSYGLTACDEGLRKKYEEIARTEGKERVHALLEEIDPESAKVLHANDVKRVIRALEIFYLTGKKKSEQNDGMDPRYAFSAFAYSYPREVLYERIDKRVDSMVASGLVEEVKGLLARGVPENAQCMQGIGYKEVVEYLKNEYSHSTMTDIIKKNTRHYAKRQLTFFQKTENLYRITPKPLNEAVKEVIKVYEDN